MKVIFGVFILVISRVFVALGIVEFYLLFLGKTHFIEGRELDVFSGLALLMIGSLSSFIGWYLSFGVGKGWYQIIFQSVALVGAVLGIKALFNFGSLSTKELVVSMFGILIAGAWWYWSNREKNA